METYKEFKKKARHPEDSIFPILFVDPIATPFAYLLKKLKIDIDPNNVTRSRLIFISPLIIACLFLAPILQMKTFYLGALILMYFYFFTDVVDGQIARGNDRKSKKGAFLDSIADRFGTFIFIVMIISFGLYLKSNYLIYGGILLFTIKGFYLMVVTKIYYYKELYNEKDDKSKVFEGKSAFDKVGLTKILDFLYKILKPILPKRCNRLLGGLEIYLVEIIIPLVFIYIGFLEIAQIYTLTLLGVFIFFFLYRISKMDL